MLGTVLYVLSLIPMATLGGLYKERNQDLVKAIHSLKVRHQ